MSPEEAQELDELLANGGHRETIAEAVAGLITEGNVYLTEDRPAWEERVREIVNADKTAADYETNHPVFFLNRWWAAAAVFVAVSIAIVLWTSRTGLPDNQSTAIQANQILPGRQGAILTLADGKQLLLDTAQNGTITLQGGATVTLFNGVLQYDQNGSEMVYNSMSTPRGRQFRLTLPDGTAVWLNNASSIRYPVAFKGTERHVEITGEAYFEVAKLYGMPFRVTVNNNTQVEVLGTHFNVKAYAGEDDIQATLLEGAVRVSRLQASGSRQPLTLRPGQQARVTGGDAAMPELIPEPDVAKVMAWKNGLFDFNNADLEEVMRQLERWYDIDVVYEKGIPRVQLVGKMTRGITLNELLIVLKELGVHFRMDGRTLIVLP